MRAHVWFDDSLLIVPSGWHPTSGVGHAVRYRVAMIAENVHFVRPVQIDRLAADREEVDQTGLVVTLPTNLGVVDLCRKAADDFREYKSRNSSFHVQSPQI